MARDMQVIIPDQYDVKEAGFSFKATSLIDPNEMVECGFFIDLGEGEDCVRTSIAFMTRALNDPRAFHAGEHLLLLDQASIQRVLLLLASSVAKYLPDNAVIVSAFTRLQISDYYRICMVEVDEPQRQFSHWVFAKDRPEGFTYPLGIRGTQLPYKGINQLRYEPDITTIHNTLHRIKRIESLMGELANELAALKASLTQG